MYVKQVVFKIKFWGFSSLFAFWPACVKAVRMLSDSDGQGKAFGIFEGGRGVAAALAASVAVILFKVGVKTLGVYVGMKYIIVFYSVLTTASGVAGIMFLPLNGSMIVIGAFVFLYILNYLFYQVNFSLSWAMMEEGAIPDKYSGTAVGLISTIGYLPDIFISLMAGKILDSYPGVDGYRYFFMILIGVLLVGAVFVKVWKAHLDKNKIEEPQLTGVNSYE